MATKVLILLGTKKGTFILESDAARRDWAQRGPYCEAWPQPPVTLRAGRNAPVEENFVHLWAVLSSKDQLCLGLSS